MYVLFLSSSTYVLLGRILNYLLEELFAIIYELTLILAAPTKAIRIKHDIIKIIHELHENLLFIGNIDTSMLYNISYNIKGRVSCQSLTKHCVLNSYSI